MAQPLSSPISKPTTIFTVIPSPPCTLLFVVILCILGLYTLHNPHSSIPTPDNIQNALRFRDIFISSATNYTISSYLRALTLHPHLAGTQQALQTAQYVQAQLKDLGLQTRMVEFKALLSYPVHASLSAHFRDGSSKDLDLTEVGQVGPDVVRPYHAYSPSGSAYAKAVFVNYGREEDYRALAALGVDVSGCVAVVRRGEFSRGGVVERAAEKGMAAVLLYADGERFNFNGVERGTVMRGLGDPLTPGWAGVGGGENLGLEDSEVMKRFPKIPSMPISGETAETILRSLEGPRVPYDWRDTLRSKVGRVGPGPTLVNFTYQLGAGQKFQQFSGRLNQLKKFME